MCWSTLFALKTLSYQSNESVGLCLEKAPRWAKMLITVSLDVPDSNGKKNKKKQAVGVNSGGIFSLDNV